MGKSPTIQFPKGDVQVNRNGRGSRGSYPDDADARYVAALKLVEAIDYNLRNGTQHYYDTRGRLLSTLDEVIHAVLTDNLAVGKPTKHSQGAEIVEWASVSDLVA
jgi:hypothetical protein